MGALCALIVGLVAGWYGHQYRERILRLKSRIKTVVDEELK